MPRKSCARRRHDAPIYPCRPKNRPRRERMARGSAEPRRPQGWFRLPLRSVAYACARGQEAQAPRADRDRPPSAPSNDDSVRLRTGRAVCVRSRLRRNIEVHGAATVSDRVPATAIGRGCQRVPHGNRAQTALAVNQRRRSRLPDRPADIAWLAAGSPRRTLPASPVPLPIGDKGYVSLFDRGPGCVGVGLQPAPSRRQVRKTRAPRRVWAVAGSHAAPVFELAEAPCPGVARRGTFRVAGLGVRAPASGRKDSLDVPLRPPGAEGVAIMGPTAIGQGRGAAVQASPRARVWVRSGRGPPVTHRCKGRSRRFARTWIWVPKPPSAAAQSGLRFLLWGAPDALTCARPTGLSRRTANRSGVACRWIRRRGPPPRPP